MEQSNHQSADTFTTRVNNRDTIVTYNRCNQSGYIYMVMVPESKVLAGSNKIRNIILALGIGFSVLAQSKRKDEIGKVATSFNTMVTSIRHLIVQSKEVSQEVNKNAQSLSNISNQSSRAASSEEVSASTQEQLSSLEELTNMALLLSTTSQNLEESLLRFKVE